MQLTDGRLASGPGPACADLLKTPASELLRAYSRCNGRGSEPDSHRGLL